MGFVPVDMDCDLSNVGCELCDMECDPINMVSDSNDI